MKTLTRFLPATVPAVLVLTLSSPAHAYVGPGAGLGVIGTLIGIVAAIVLAMFGLLWYPLKRAFGKKAAADGASVQDDASLEAAEESTAARAGASTHDASARADAARQDGMADAHGDTTR